MRPLLYLLLFLLTGCAAKRQTTASAAPAVGDAAAISQISPRQALRAITSDTLLLDVREAAELAELRYGVDNQLDIPLSELPRRLHEVPRDRPIIVACYSGGRSTKAIALLREAGYTDLFNLAGGMSAWQQEGLPVDTPKE